MLTVNPHSSPTSPTLSPDIVCAARTAPRLRPLHHVSDSTKYTSTWTGDFHDGWVDLGRALYPASDMPHRRRRHLGHISLLWLSSGGSTLYNIKSTLTPRCGRVWRLNSVSKLPQVCQSTNIVSFSLVSGEKWATGFVRPPFYCVCCTLVCPSRALTKMKKGNWKML